MAQPYSIRLHIDEEGDWIASIPELKGCIAHGSTEAEAVANVREVQALWIEEATSQNEVLPEPVTYEMFQATEGKH